jgi:tetraacyldisaccharide 4'-kinase
MLSLHDWQAMHEKRGGVASTPFLALLSLMYGLAVRLWLIVRQNRPRKSLPGVVISIGNLTVGGTGKTPLACMLAEWAVEKGHGTAVLSRGYGGNNKSKVLVVSDGNDLFAGPDRAGDEPYLMARKLQGVPVIISKNRYLAGLEAVTRFRSRLMILDDGFQHIGLKRDLDIVLIDAGKPFGNGHLLPWGPLREPVENLARADVIILTRSGQSPGLYHPADILGKFIREKPVFRGDHVPEKVVFPFKETAIKPEFLKGKRVIAFAGIARPGAFKRSLEELGARIVDFRSFGDHHRFSPRELDSLMSRKEQIGADYLITTEKDWVRLEKDFPKYMDLAYLKIQFALVSGREEFFHILKERIEIA